MTIGYAPTAAAGGKKLIWAVRLLTAGACAISIFLIFKSTQVGTSGGGGCGPGGGCEQVFSSRWSGWLGLPVALPGASLYAAMCLLTFPAAGRDDTPRRRLAWTLLAALSVTGAVAGIWFIALQIGKIGHYCPWCLTVHTCGIIIAILLLAGPARHRHLIESPAISIAGGLLGVAFLIGGQLLAVGPSGLLVTSNPTTHPASGSSGSGRVITVGTLELDVNDFPIIGSPTAPHLLGLVGDYTCPHCRELHHRLDRARQRYGEDQFALVVIPTAMNGDCNPWITHTSDMSKNACELDGLALAVWKLAPAHYGEFDKWLFATFDSRPPGDARLFAEDLAGGPAKIAELKDSGWIKQNLLRDADIYHELSNHPGSSNGKVPKLIFPDIVTHGDVTNDEELFHLLEKHLGLKPTAPANGS